jgi:hypothetical protein
MVMLLAAAALSILSASVFGGQMEMKSNKAVIMIATIRPWGMEVTLHDAASILRCTFVQF